jgi:predicted nucleic acid-binding protein
MKKLKIYLDTSVINFLFADDAPEYKSVTEDFFQNFIHEYDVYISEIVYLEINKTDNPLKKNNLLHAVKQYNLKVYDTVNDEIETLANLYVKSKVIPQHKYEDALHIAFCTYYEFDILLSWNFRHLANIKKQLAVNSINKNNGYCKDLNLFNPMEVIYEK